MSRYTTYMIDVPQGGQHEIVECPREVVVVLVCDEDREQFILVKQWRAGAGKELVEPVAGYIEEGETPEEAAIRECREEIGYEPKELIYCGKFYKSPGWTNEIAHYFIGFDLEHNPLPQDEGEYIEVVRTDKFPIELDEGTDLSMIAVAGMYASLIRDPNAMSMR